MSDEIVSAITKPKGRKSLFHFTRVRNLPAMAHLDALLSSYRINRETASGGRRPQAVEVQYEAYPITLNAHLKIADIVIDTSTTQEQFRAYLDRHVFLWPTLRDCRKMMETYARREPDESFAVLEMNAHALLSGHRTAVKLSKYDSGSSPRFPAACTYKKSPDMFLPLDRFKQVSNHTVPAKVSEIHEVLVEDQVTGITRLLQTIWIDRREAAPLCWREKARALSELRDLETGGRD